MSRFDAKNFLNVLEFEHAAKAALDPIAWDYYRSGSWGEQTVRWNCEGWERLRIFHRVMVDVSRRDASIALLGARIPFPLLLAPTALHKFAHEEGEIATARGAAAVGCPMILSSFSSVAIEDVVSNTSAPVWMQLYIGKDREFTLTLIDRAARAGCTALVLTVDTPVWGVRERDVRNAWCLRKGIDVVNLVRADREGPTGHSGAGIGEALGWAIDAALSWKDLAWLVERTSLPILVKGICRADDALKAIDHGARGVIVSNHGGRQLDGAPATAESLPAVASAVRKRVPVLVDGGIRRGTDIVRALALGADAVAVGRPILWGLAAGGSDGVRRVLELLRAEFDLAMALCGCRSVDEITREMLS